MKNFKRLLASFVMLLAILGVNPIVAHADWRQSEGKWWYSQGGSSYATSWTQINGKWYYFDEYGYMKTGWLYDSGNWFYFYGDGTMAHDTTIDGCYLNSSGAWTNTIPAQNTNSNSSSGSYSYGGTQYVDANGSGLIKGTSAHIYHVPGSTYYNRTKNVERWFKTVEEAEAAGYRAPER